MTTDKKTHDSLATSVAVWFAVLSPLIGVALGLVGACLFSQVGG